MPTYISLVNLTEQGIREVKNAPERLQAFDSAAREAGGSCRQEPPNAKPGLRYAREMFSTWSRHNVSITSATLCTGAYGTSCDSRRCVHSARGRVAKVLESSARSFV